MNLDSSLSANLLHTRTRDRRQRQRSQKAKEKRLQEEVLQEELRNQFKRLNVTTSIIPGGCTSYVQALDVSVNKAIKQYLEEYEDLHAGEHFDEWKAGKYSVGDRRIPLTHWVAKAWERLHIEHKDTTIKTFRNVGLALNPDGSEDAELSIRDLPNIAVGDYTRVLEASIENPIVIPNNVGDTIEVDSEDDITTDSGDKSDTRFDYDPESSFNNDVDGDEDEQDEDME
jgi:hypothetical protein